MFKKQSKTFFKSFPTGDEKDEAHKKSCFGDDMNKASNEHTGRYSY